MHSSEQVEVALEAYLTRCLLTPYFWPEGVVGGEGGCSISLWLQLAVLGGAVGLFVLFVSNFCILILPYLQTFYFEVVILSGGRLPLLVPVLVQLLVAVLVVEDSTLLE